MSSEERHDTLVVIGGGFSGKLAAIAASKYIKNVIIIEKNRLNEGELSVNVAQKDHVHILLNRGLKEIENICPGFSIELLNKKSVKYDMKKYFYWDHYGGEKYRYDGDYFTFQQSRKSLEDILSKYVRQKPNITTYYETRFTNFICESDNNGNTIVTGIKLNKKGSAITIYANCFVFSVGNPAITKKKLLPQVKSTTRKLGLLYQSRNYVFNNADTWKGIACSPLFPNQPFGAVILKNEKSEYTLTLSSYSTNENKIDRDCILSKLRNKKIVDFTRTAEPLTEWKSYAIPQIEYLHIKKMKEKPLNVFVVGNAYCSLDPIFGQGLTVSAVQVSMLQKALENSSTIEKAGKLYYENAEKIIKNALDLTYAETAQLSTKISLINRVKHQFIVYFSQMSTYDKDVLDDFVSVMHFDKQIKDILTARKILKIGKHIIFKRRTTYDSTS